MQRAVRDHALSVDCDKLNSASQFLKQALHYIRGCETLEQLRGYEGEADASIITEHIRRIRAKLRAVDEEYHLETVWGLGYRWGR